MTDEITRPKCKWCGKPIRKKTDTTSYLFTEIESAPKSKEEAQRMTNHQVVSVRYGEYRGKRYVRSFSTWDGVSYVSPHFCADTTCGLAYAYHAADNAQ